MMHQPVYPSIAHNDRPVREEIILKDEIIGLKIDLETLTLDEFYVKYFEI
jgi:hypothetical protein